MLKRKGCDRKPCLYSGGVQNGGVRFASSKKARPRFDWTLVLCDCRQCCHSCQSSYRDLCYTTT